MGARISEAMIKAKKLMVDKHMTANEAAKVSGLTASAIYMSAWYKDFKRTKQGVYGAKKI